MICWTKKTKSHKFIYGWSLFFCFKNLDLFWFGKKKWFWFVKILDLSCSMSCSILDLFWFVKILDLSCRKKLFFDNKKSNMFYDDNKKKVFHSRKIRCVFICMKRMKKTFYFIFIFILFLKKRVLFIIWIYAIKN